MTDSINLRLENIIRSAKDCGNISRIVRITPFPDFPETDQPLIAIAVFGKINRCQYLQSEEFRRFYRTLFAFGGDYDVLYFSEKDSVPEHIRDGEVIYAKV